MGPEYITYKNVSVFSGLDGKTAAAGLTNITIGPYYITPVKNLFILQVRLSLRVYDFVTFSNIPDSMVFVSYNLPSMSAAGIDINPLYPNSAPSVTVLNGMQTDAHIMRTAPSGQQLNLLSGVAYFPAALINNARVITTFDMFYILLN